ncbi:MAG: flavodoxin-dependent (E)-4-hydroxy-3-methylbut-2-enyl-diphosphate synthase, partial [Bacillota bacterium]|nr:flavodoxin-dependent (E)-4-hydroxy-3-methylbut-2-enyl-diphosphate synthase [Bacillota bacterium]
MTTRINVGGIIIGGGAPITIQSMTNTDTEDAKATLEQIKRLSDAGCEIVRVSVPTQEAVEALKIIAGRSPIPVVADIHFDYRLAIASIEAGASKVRINPG